MRLHQRPEWFLYTAACAHRVRSASLFLCCNWSAPKLPLCVSLDHARQLLPSLFVVRSAAVLSNHHAHVIVLPSYWTSPIPRLLPPPLCDNVPLLVPLDAHHSVHMDFRSESLAPATSTAASRSKPFCCTHQLLQVTAAVLRSV